VVVDELRLAAPKTKEMAAVLDALPVETSVLIVLPEKDEMVERAARNLPGVKVLPVNLLNVADLLSYKYLMLPEAALQAISRLYGAKA